MSDVTEESSAPKEDAQPVRVRRAFYAYADSYTAMYGVAVWKPIEEMPFVKTDRAGRSKHYSESLTDCPVLDTLSAAFDALAELAAEPITPPPSPGAMT